MRDNKLHTPEGFRDFLPEQWATQKTVGNHVESVFHRYGYVSVNSPALEYMEVFAGSGSVRPKEMFRFIDRDGDTLAFRCDITPPIARMAATNYTMDDAPLRFCYIQNILKYNESYQGKNKEITQAGVELLGVSSLEADAEVLAVGINACLAAGLTGFHLDIGQVQFLQGIMEASGLEEDIAQTLYGYIVEKDFVAAEQMAREKKAPAMVVDIISQLPLLTGGKEILKKAATLFPNAKSVKALEDLDTIYHLLADYGLQDYIVFDLSMAGNMDYYSGIIFKGYTYGLGFTIVDGGRYDNLSAHFGGKFPSVGFVIKINNLVSALEKNATVGEPIHADTLVAYTELGRTEALKTADELRSQGLSIENSFLGPELETNKRYAVKKGISGILYFKNAEEVLLVNLIENKEETVTIGQLLKGGAL